LTIQVVNKTLRTKSSRISEKKKKKKKKKKKIFGGLILNKMFYKYLYLYRYE